MEVEAATIDVVPLLVVAWDEVRPPSLGCFRSDVLRVGPSMPDSFRNNFGSHLALRRGFRRSIICFIRMEDQLMEWIPKFVRVEKALGPEAARIRCLFKVCVTCSRVVARVATLTDQSCHYS